jgi:hypothetical protein
MYYMWTVRGGPWPDSQWQLVAYLESRAAEPCGPTVIPAILTAVKWIEQVGDLETKWGTHPGVVGCAGALTMSLEIEGQQRKKAPRFPVSFILAMELLLVNPGRSHTLRVAAFYRLLKVWGTLRFDDTFHLGPAGIWLEEEVEGGPSALRGTLPRTKTSGPGKRSKALPLYIAPQAYVGVENWMEVGVELLKGGPFPMRDYLMPSLGPRGDFVNNPASYKQVVLISTKLLSQLKIPERTLDGLGWVEGTRPLVPDSQLASYWTEHSERATLPSLAGHLKFSKELVDKLGRWQEGAQSDAYIREFYGVVRQIQMEVARVLRSGEAYHRFSEKANLHEMELWMNVHGYTEDRKQGLLGWFDAVLKSVGTVPMADPAEPGATVLEGNADPAEGLIDQLGPEEAREFEEGIPQPRTPEKAPDSDESPKEAKEGEGAPKSPSEANLSSRAKRAEGPHEPTEPPPLKYFVVFEKSRYRGKLHRSGVCAWAGKHKVRDGQGYDSPLEEVPYTSVCVRCFPGDQDSSSESSV